VRHLWDTCEQIHQRGFGDEAKSDEKRATTKKKKKEYRYGGGGRLAPSILRIFECGLWQLKIQDSKKTWAYLLQVSDGHFSKGEQIQKMTINVKTHTEGTREGGRD